MSYIEIGGIANIQVAPESCIVTPASSNKLAGIYAGLFWWQCYTRGLGEESKRLEQARGGQRRLRRIEQDSVWLDGDSTQRNLIYLRVIPCTRSPEFDFSQPQTRFLVAARITGIPTHAAGPRIMVSTIIMSQKGPVNMEVLAYSITKN